jgi:hypothetical protein
MPEEGHRQPDRGSRSASPASGRSGSPLREELGVAAAGKLKVVSVGELEGRCRDKLEVVGPAGKLGVTVCHRILLGKLVHRRPVCWFRSNSGLG